MGSPVRGRNTGSRAKREKVGMPLPTWEGGGIDGWIIFDGPAGAGPSGGGGGGDARGRGGGGGGAARRRGRPAGSRSGARPPTAGRPLPAWRGAARRSGWAAGRS